MRIHEHEFVDQVVHMDFHEFDHCTFTRCRLIIHGFGTFKLSGCSFDVACRFEFADAAANTLAVLAAMYHGGFQALIEATIKNIRVGSHPEVP